MNAENSRFAEVVESYQSDGFAVARVFTEEQFTYLHDFTCKWVGGLVRDASEHAEKMGDLEDYHLWAEGAGVRHDGLFRAGNRYIEATGKLREILLNDSVNELLKEIHEGELDLWRDPGLGWVGFRFVRPGRNDGYPTSCKAWGAATHVISCWLPILGFTPPRTIALVPGSHKKEYPKYLPENQKFTSGEYRLVNPDSVSFVRPTLKIGEAIFFHPRTLHTEDVIEGNKTRLNLEYRFNPV